MSLKFCIIFAFHGGYLVLFNVAEKHADYSEYFAATHYMRVNLNYSFCNLTRYRLILFKKKLNCIVSFR